MSENAKPVPFVPLSSIKQGGSPLDPATALANIRQIYFKTSRRTIEHDFAHAIALLKSLPDEETRAKAHVYMEGLAEMQREWARTATKAPSKSRGKRKKRGPTSGPQSSGGQ